LWRSIINELSNDAKENAHQALYASKSFNFAGTSHTLIVFFVRRPQHEQSNALQLTALLTMTKSV